MLRASSMELLHTFSTKSGFSVTSYWQNEPNPSFPLDHHEARTKNSAEIENFQVNHELRTLRVLDFAPVRTLGCMLTMFLAQVRGRIGENDAV